MRYQHGLVIASLTLVACAPAPAPIESVSQANFVNGGFEAGNLGSWTQTRALWGTGAGTVGFVTFPPRTLTDLRLTSPAGTALMSVVTAGIPAELTAPDSLRLPFFGVDAAKVNSPIGGAGNHNSNYIQQSMVTSVADVDATDGLIHVRFAAAPVLDFPTPAHNPDQQPYMFIEITNTTKGVALYNTFNFSNQPGVIWKTAAAQVGGSPVVYTDWAAFDLAPGPSGIGIGDTIQATVVGTGCSFNAHFGEVYVDEFGTSFPYPNVNVTAPNFVSPNNDLTYTVTAKNNGTGSATNVIVNITTPPVSDSNLVGVANTVDTTYVSTNAPGAVCNAPTVGAINQTLTCNVGNLGPGQSYTFTFTVHVPAIPGTHVAPDFVNEGLYTLKTDQRPTPLNGGIVQTQVSATTVVGLQTTLTDNTPSVVWGQASDTYTLTVTNFGPVASNGVVITDTRPAQLTAPVMWTCVGAGGGVCNAASGAGAINTTANLPVGASVTYTIPTSVIAGVGNSSFTYTAKAVPPAGQVQSTLFNNIGTDTDTVAPSLFTLTTNKDVLGNGTGTIVSVPSGPNGINCGALCAQAFANGTQVALTALPTAGSVFTGWTGGGCVGTTNPCVVTVSAATTVTARFDKPVLVTALVTTSNGGSQNVRPGDTAVYSVKITIPANAAAAPVLVTDLFPAGLAYSSATAPTTAGTGVISCSVGLCTAPTIVTGTTTTWDFGGVSCSAAGSCEIDFTVTGRVAVTATLGSTLVDSIDATLMGTQLQPALTVIEPNLTVSRVTAPAMGLIRGQPETVTVTLANNTGGANSSAFDVVATLPIPAGYTGGSYVAGTCPVATTATFTGGNATFTFPTGAAGAIAAGTTCTFTYQVTGNANSTGNATVSLAAGTATSKSITGAAPPAKQYTTNPPAISFMTAAIANGGVCAALAECVSMVCDTDNKCGYADGDGPCTLGNGAVVCRSGQCSNSGLCLPMGQCFVDADCNTTQYCDTQAHACAPKIPNGGPVPTLTGHSPPLTGTCNVAVGTAVCTSGACDTADNGCGLADGHGPCASGIVCRSTFCSASGVCAAVGSCLVDGDCDTSTQFCDTETSACTPKIPNGGPIPTISGHTPPLAGQCSLDAAVAVCVSAVCDTADQECGYANGHGSCDPTTAMVVCRSGVCGNDGLCGYPDGQGPCDGTNATKVCRGMMCSNGGTCGTSCKIDGDCNVSTQFCNTESGACTLKLDNGTPIPTISGHAPPLDGMCSSAEATVVCKSAVCDPTDNRCGYTEGSQPCTPDNGPTVCRSGSCGQTGVCAKPGVSYGFTGGGLSCQMTMTTTTATGRSAPLALGLLMVLGFLRRRAARQARRR